MRCLLLLALLVSSPAWANQQICSSIVPFQKNKLMVLNEIVTEHLHYPTLHDFKADTRIIEYQFGAMPNHFRAGREGHLIYQLLLHYLEFSTTIYYDSETSEIVENKMYHAW